jgi:opacity protein-like surface antigen
MKKSFFFLFAFALFFSVQAQSLRFGVKAGANFSDFSGSDAKDLSADMKVGFHIGALIEFKLFENFSLQPEVMYSSKGAKLDNVGEIDFDDVDLNYITVPVLAKFYLISDKLSIEAGPQFSFLLDDNLEEQLESKSFDFAALAGLNYQFTDNVFAQLRYVAGLTDSSEDAEIRNQVFQLSLGYRF